MFWKSSFAQISMILGPRDKPGCRLPSGQGAFSILKIHQQHHHNHHHNHHRHHHRHHHHHHCTQVGCCGVSGPEDWQHTAWGSGHQVAMVVMINLTMIRMLTTMMTMMRMLTMMTILTPMTVKWRQITGTTSALVLLLDYKRWIYIDLLQQLFRNPLLGKQSSLFPCFFFSRFPPLCDSQRVGGILLV